MNVAELAVSTVGMGSGLGFGFFAVRWLAGFLAGRFDKREAQLDASTEKLIKGLETQIDNLSKRFGHALERLDQVETELSECKRLHAESEADRARLKAMMQGYGDARQHAQLIVSAEMNKEHGHGDTE